MTEFDPNDPNDAWQLKSSDAVWRFGQELKAFHQSNPWPDHPVLPKAMTSLMTELWDAGFSQTEIRGAFEAAITHMARYTAGEERRS